MKVTNGVSYQQARKTVEAANPEPSKKSYAAAAKTQTVSVETQTDLIPQLPPLKLLPPVSPVPAVGTQTSVLATPEPSAPQTDRRRSPDTPSPQATARPGTWQTARGRGRAGPGRQATASPHTHSPTRDRSERQARPAVRVAMGKNRSQSQSVGRYPPRGGNSLHT